MKAFIERPLPMLEPYFEMQDDRTFHPQRHKPPGAVILSVAGFVEMAVFCFCLILIPFVQAVHAVHNINMLRIVVFCVATHKLHRLCFFIFSL